MNETAPVQPPNAPSGFDPNALTPEDTSRWPKVIGVFSLIYALGGLLCNVSYGVMSVFMESLLKMQGAEVSVPISMKVIGVFLALCNLILGVILITGAVRLLQRRRSGVKLTQRWAVARLCVLVIASLSLFVTSAPQIDVARAQVQAGNRQRAQRNIEPVPMPSDEALHRRNVITTAVFVGLASVYPLFLGLYLSRRKIQDQIKHWPTR